jgi:hypothetical protein
MIIFTLLYHFTRTYSFLIVFNQSIINVNDLQILMNPENLVILKSLI